MIKFMKVCGWFTLGIVVLIAGLGIAECITGTEILPRKETSSTKCEGNTAIEIEQFSEMTSELESVKESESTSVLKAAPIEFVIAKWHKDFLGGNTITVWVKNLTNKTITWIEYTLSFYNVKGELLYDDIRVWPSMTWYDGPILPGERFGIDGGIFYDSNAKSVVVDKIIIHYEDDSEEVITQRDLTAYTPIIFNSKEFTVWTSQHAASYHTHECTYYKNNSYDLELTLSEAQAQGKSKCPYCLP